MEPVIFNEAETETVAQYNAKASQAAEKLTRFVASLSKWPEDEPSCHLSYKVVNGHGIAYDNRTHILKDGAVVAR